MLGKATMQRILGLPHPLRINVTAAVGKAFMF